MRIAQIFLRAMIRRMMTKRELQALLDESGSGLMQLADELGLARSTVSRWTDTVPQYAVSYAVLRAALADTKHGYALERALLRIGLLAADAGQRERAGPSLEESA